MSKHGASREDQVQFALEEALNTAAPDSESWTAGWDAFYQDHHDTLDGQLEHALDAAAPDPESWTAGWEKFHDLYHETASSTILGQLRAIPSYFKRK